MLRTTRQIGNGGMRSQRHRQLFSTPAIIHVYGNTNSHIRQPSPESRTFFHGGVLQEVLNRDPCTIAQLLTIQSNKSTFQGTEKNTDATAAMFDPDFFSSIGCTKKWSNRMVLTVILVRACAQSHDSSMEAGRANQNLPVVIVSFHIDDNLEYGYRTAIPMMQVAVKKIQAKYPKSLGNITLVPVVYHGVSGCDDVRFYKLLVNRQYSRPFC